MRFVRVTSFVAALLLGLDSAAQAQDPRSVSVTVPLQFESWRPTVPSESSSKLGVELVSASRDRGDQALLGGVIGAAAGLVTCTVISTIMDDSAEGGLSFCPLDTSLLFVAGGFALGAAVGWLISDEDGGERGNDGMTE
jgi:hypothetical protein